MMNEILKMVHHTCFERSGQVECPLQGSNSSTHVHDLRTIFLFALLQTYKGEYMYLHSIEYDKYCSFSVLAHLTLKKTLL